MAADPTTELVSLYKASLKNMREMVLKPTGRTEGAQEFRQARAAQLGNQIDSMLRELGQRTTVWAKKNVQAAAAKGMKSADNQATEAGVRPEGKGTAGSFALIDRRAVEIFAKTIVEDLDAATTAAADRAKRIIRKTAQMKLDEPSINRILAGGVIEGQPVETIRKLREELRAVHGDTVVVKTRNGSTMDFEVGYYAKMVAVTATRSAVEYSRHERLKDIGLDLVMVIGRVSNNFCTAFLGQVFSLSGKSDKYPAYSSLPGGGAPFHPNCSKSTRAYVEELATDEQQAMAETTTDTKKLIALGDTSKAQRAYKDLQMRQGVEGRYGDTEKAVYGKGFAGNKPGPKMAKPRSPEASTPAQPARRPSKRQEADLVQVQKATGHFAGDRTGSEAIPDQPKLPRTAREAADKTAELRAKLERVRAARLESQAKLESLRAEITDLQNQLSAAIAAGSRREIEELKRKIAAAERAFKNAEAAVRRAEKND